MEQPVGEPGEVLVRGYSVMRGYLDDPTETARAIDGEGWLHTGDLGVIDERGCLRIVGRKKDMFIVGGFNAYPAEIENLLLGHPAVGRAAVVGMPDERLGEVGMAFVVLAPGAELQPDELIEWARGAMANYKVPRAVEIVGELPVNAAGKVEKEILRHAPRIEGGDWRGDVRPGARWRARRVVLPARRADAASDGTDVYTPTMTGLGERSHLLRPDIDLDIHIRDITAVLHYEDLREVILVGHSYGGMVITGVADRAERPRRPAGLPGRRQSGERPVARRRRRAGHRSRPGRWARWSTASSSCFSRAHRRRCRSTA